MSVASRRMASRLRAAGMSEKEIEEKVKGHKYSKASSVDPNERDDSLYDSADASSDSPDVGGPNYSNMALAASRGGSASDTASSVAIASGNPYAMAAGLALKTLSAQQKAKQADKEARYLSKQKRIERQQRAISQLMSMSQGMSL